MKKYKNYLILIIFTMGSQALIYFLLKLFISEYNTIYSAIDFPFVKEFIFIYNAWYPFILLSAFLIYKYDRNIFKYLITTMLLGAFISHITFIVYPSLMIRPTFEVHNITDWFLDFTYRNDYPAVNCFPSIHCLYCFIMMYYSTKCKDLGNKKRLMIYIFLSLVVISTLLVHQHIIEDIILSLIYAIIVIFIVNLCSKKVDKIFDKLHLS